MSRSRRAALAALTTFTLALGACSAADQRSNSSGTNGTAQKTVTILTHDSFALPDELVQRFEEESGYTLKTTSPGDAGVVVNQLILTKDHPTVDGVYGIDNYSAYLALNEGVLAPYTSDDLPDSAEQYVLDDALTPIDMGDVCVNVDHQWFSDHSMDEPETLADLAKPEYAKLLVVENPATSSPGFAFLTATIAEAGADGYLDYWTQLLEGGAKVDDGWSDAYYTDFSGADGQGDYPLVVSYASSPAETDGATGSLEATCTRQVEYAGVVEGAANPEGAQAFIDFMLSDDVQAALPESMYMYPVNSTIDLPEQWAANASLADNPLAVDPQEVASQRETWIKDWTELFESRS